MPLRRLLAAAGLGLLALAGAAVALDRIYPPALERYRERSTLVLDSNGKLLRGFTTSDGMWRLQTRPRDVDPTYLKMLLAYEDKRFRWHPGVDPLAVIRAAGQLVRHGRIVSGASTLTMQVARLLEPRPRTFESKLIEMLRALQLEARYTKEEILTLYLTLAPFGGNLEGVRAASLAYLGKEPRHLSTAEAALLVSLPQSPERRRPDQRPAIARAERDRTIERLAAAGVLTTLQRREALDQPVPAHRRALPFHAPHLAAHLAGEQPSGGSIRTTLKADIQQAAEALARSEADKFADGADLAMLVVENRTRRVLAYVGSADFFSAAGQNDLVRARRSPGSALKPFIYGLAFDDGFVHPETLIDDAPTRFGDYAPRNFDRDYQGVVSIRTALQQSLNLPAVALLQRVGPERFTAALQQAGAGLALPRSQPEGSLAVALGGAGISLLDLTALYAGLAEGGDMRALRLREAEANPPGRRLMSARAAWYVTDILTDSPLPDSLSRAAGLEQRRSVAFKTGTSYGFRDAWAVGYSPAYTIGVWVGHANGTPRPGQYGRNTAAPILLKAFDLLPGEDGSRPRPPQDALVVGSYQALPPGLQFLSAAPGEAPALHAKGRIVTANNRPRILFPPAGATVELPSGGPGQLVLKAEGGVAPLRWLVNERPLPATPSRRTDTFWTPDGEGFARIAVIDAEGRSAAVEVRVQRAP